MEIDQKNKIIVDKKNKYLFDNKDIVVFLNTDEEFETLKEYDNKEYSIKGTFIGDNKKESVIVTKYKIAKATDAKELKESNKFKMMLLDKLNIKSSKNGGVIVLKFEKMKKL